MHVLDMPEIKNTASPSHPFRCVFLTLPNYSLIALSSAVEALRMANRVAGQEAYQWSIASMGGHPVAASNGLALAPTVALADVAQAHIVFVCGGIEIEARGSRGSVRLVFDDPFSAFRGALAAFLEQARSGVEQIPRNQTLAVVRLIEAGTRA